MSTKYFPQDANADTTCDTTAKAQDMSKTQGTTTTSGSDSVSDTPFVEVHSFDIDATPDSPGSGSHDVSLDVNTMSAGATGRYRIQAVDDAGCGVSASSAYSANFTSATSFPHLLTGTSLAWAAGDERLRLSVELSRDSGQHGGKSVTSNVQDVDSFVDAPWPIVRRRLILGGT